MKRIVVLCLTLLLAFAVSAQEKATPKAKPKPAAPGMGMPKPSPEMQKLIKTLSGKWTTVEKHEPGPFMPNGGEAKGEATFSPGPGRLSLIENYRSLEMVQPQKGKAGFRGHGVMWWDSKSGSYTGVWCDNSVPGGCQIGGTSKWQGNDIVGSMETEVMGKKAQIKDRFTNITPNSFTYTMEMGDDGGAMKKVMTIEYTRAAAAPAKPAAEKKQ